METLQSAADQALDEAPAIRRNLAYRFARVQPAAGLSLGEDWDTL